MKVVPVVSWLMEGRKEARQAGRLASQPLPSPHGVVGFSSVWMLIEGPCLGKSEEPRQTSNKKGLIEGGTWMI